MSKMSLQVRVQLSLMMFFQFLMFAVWWQPLADFLNSEIGVTGSQFALIMSTMAFGCLIAPIIGMIADRHFASQKVLAALNLLGGVLLFVAAKQTNRSGDLEIGTYWDVPPASHACCPHVR